MIDPEEEALPRASRQDLVIPKELAQYVSRGDPGGCPEPPLPRSPDEHRMTQTTNRFFDELARLMTDAAGAAQGLRREFETFFKGQGERLVREMNLVQREELEAVKAMAVKAREENEKLAARISALEAEVKRLGGGAARSEGAIPVAE
jgi:BMFP domain-containing protein YqiC